MAESGKEAAAVGGDLATREVLTLHFGTNEVERQLRVALRTAQKGDPLVAAELLDKVLAIEPVNREALLGRASLALKQANAASDGRGSSPPPLIKRWVYSVAHASP